MAVLLGAIKGKKESPYQIYLDTYIIYSNLPIGRLKSVLYSLKYDLKENLEDYFISKNNKNIKNANELKWNLSNVKSFDNILSLKNKIKQIENYYA